MLATFTMDIVDALGGIGDLNGEYQACNTELYCFTLLTSYSSYYELYLETE